MDLPWQPRLRVAKDAHFVSDVLMGAAIGIGVVKLVYALDHLFAWNPFLKTDKIITVPSIGINTYGVSTVIKF